METLKKVMQFIDSNQLLLPGERVLVGVSGGVDSVVLLDMLSKAGYECVVAHCNFHLREKESDRDEKFVEEFALSRKLLFKKIDFDTTTYAKSNKISIEMAARELRYRWFYQLASEQNCSSIAVAHHADDSVETILFNLIRGTGLKGLKGIDAVNDKVIRPLLSCNRNEIEAYAETNELKFVIDSTNNLNDFSRNKIRNRILPLMAEINPSIRQTLIETADRLKGTWEIYSDSIRDVEKKIANQEEGQYFIRIQKLKKQLNPATILYELLHPFHFNPDVVNDIQENLDSEPGKRYYSETHRLLKDRDFLIVDAIKPRGNRVYQIESLQSEITFPIRLTFETKRNDATFRLINDSNLIQVDADKLQFPLVLRRWKPGETFFPFGMKRSKKLSDFFIDEKINRNQKEDTWLLISGDKIVWIVGLRLDDRFRIEKNTKTILEINFKRQ
ncbi:MAG: tRNA lysidine(34) synthetase TilS [Paludibacteraceae bacterium]